MNIIDELVTDAESRAEDKGVYKSLVDKGVVPFETEKISDVVTASEISQIIIKEITNRVSACDASVASLVFEQTAEGLKSLNKKQQAYQAVCDVNSSAAFHRCNNSEELFMFKDDVDLEDKHKITEEESVALNGFLDQYKKDLDEKFDQLTQNPYMQLMFKKYLKSQLAFIDGVQGKFKRG
jgi:hypothetical protein